MLDGTLQRCGRGPMENIMKKVKSNVIQSLQWSVPGNNRCHIGFSGGTQEVLTKTGPYNSISFALPISAEEHRDIYTNLKMGKEPKDWIAVIETISDLFLDLFCFSCMRISFHILWKWQQILILKGKERPLDLLDYRPIWKLDTTGKTSWKIIYNKGVEGL